MRIPFGGSGQLVASTLLGLHVRHSCFVPTACLMLWQSGRPNMKANTVSSPGS
jgi:hypothetical protein